MTNNGMVWEEPPVAHDRRGRWMPFLEALQERPGEWGVLHEQSPEETEQQARNRQVAITALAARHSIKLETATRTVNGRIKVYGRVSL